MAGLVMVGLENSLGKLQGFPGMLSYNTSFKPEWELEVLKVWPCLLPGRVPFLVCLGVLVPTS